MYVYTFKVFEIFVYNYHFHFYISLFFANIFKNFEKYKILQLTM